MNTDTKYIVPYAIPSSRLDAKCRFSLDGIISLTQDLAASHYGSGGLSIPHLQKKGLTWVITRQHFEIYEYPLWLDTIQAATWAKPVKGPFCYRDFLLSYIPGGRKESINAALTGNSVSQTATTPIFAGTSCWMVLSLVDGHPIKPDASLFGTLPFCTEDALSSVFPRIQLCDAWDSEIIIEPNGTDIDLNRHVNNLNYVHWILSSIPLSISQSYLVSTLDTYFISSAKYGEKLICRLHCEQQNDNSWQCIHSIIRANDSSEVFRAQTQWQQESLLSRELKVE